MSKIFAYCFYFEYIKKSKRHWMFSTTNVNGSDLNFSWRGHKSDCNWTRSVENCFHNGASNQKNSKKHEQTDVGGLALKSIVDCVLAVCVVSRQSTRPWHWLSWSVHPPTGGSWGGMLFRACRRHRGSGKNQSLTKAMGKNNKIINRKNGGECD